MSVSGKVPAGEDVFRRGAAGALQELKLGRISSMVMPMTDPVQFLLCGKLNVLSWLCAISTRQEVLHSTSWTGSDTASTVKEILPSLSS